MKIVSFAFCAIATSLLFGCSTDKDIALDPSLKTYDRKSLDNSEIQMPANYNRDNYKKLLLGVVVNDIGVKKGDISQTAVQTLSSRLQTEMAKLKRFSVFSAHNRNGVNFFQSLADVGDAKMPEVEMKSLDLVLTASITVSKEKHDRYNDQLIIYEVECDFNCEDLKTHQVKFAEKAQGRTARAIKLSLSGKKLGGYSDEDELQAIYNAAMKALAVAANKLGNYYPVGGRITGVLGERMTLDKGFEDGIGGKMQMVIYTNIGGVDVPLAIAESSPSTTSANLVVWRWNDDDKYAEQVHDATKKDPNWIKTNQLYAVSYGMAVPPEWEKSYKESFDESMRIK